MAALAQSAVTVNDAYKGLGTSGRKFLFKDVTLALTGQGGLTNNIPKALFGMTSIVGALAFRDTTSSALFSAAPSTDGALLVFATTETAGTPTDQTATVRGIVFGYDG